MAAALARRSAVTLSRPTSVSVIVPRAARLARAGGRFAATQAMEERHTLVALGGAAIAGYVQRNNIQVPHIAAIGVPGTYGLAAWALGRYTKNRTMQHLATGLLAVAAYQMTV